jgi:hypothetical protein
MTDAIDRAVELATAAQTSDPSTRLTLLREARATIGAAMRDGGIGAGIARMLDRGIQRMLAGAPERIGGT